MQKEVNLNLIKLKNTKPRSNRAIKMTVCYCEQFKDQKTTKENWEKPRTRARTMLKDAPVAPAGPLLLTFDMCSRAHWAVSSQKVHFINFVIQPLNICDLKWWKLPGKWQSKAENFSQRRIFGEIKAFFYICILIKKNNNNNFEAILGISS